MFLYDDNNSYNNSISYFTESLYDQFSTYYDNVSDREFGLLSLDYFYLSNIFNNGVFVNNINSQFSEHDIYTELKIRNYSLNICPGLELNVARDCFSDNRQIKELEFAIFKAAHIAILEKSDFDKDQKEVLKSFITTYFSRKTRYCKQ